jgi:hypothetical protein
VAFLEAPWQFISQKSAYISFMLPDLPEGLKLNIFHLG